MAVVNIYTLVLQFQWNRLLGMRFFGHRLEIFIILIGITRLFKRAIIAHISNKVWKWPSFPSLIALGVTAL